MSEQAPVYGVVLAGGSGSRFWPRSRQLFPKQLCRLLKADETLIESTLKRFQGIAKKHFVVTHSLQAAKTREILRNKSSAVVIAEPEMRNTAAALSLAALAIKAVDPNPEAVMISTHADHNIDDVNALHTSLHSAVAAAQRGYLCLVGISPSRPETGFGYIERGDKLAKLDAYAVSSFREKPSKERAQAYVRAGSFYWNTGLFVWKVDTFLAELRTHAPTVLRALEDFCLRLKEQGNYNLEALLQGDSLESIYKDLPDIAIDHALLEKSANIAMVQGAFAWDDVGTWTALEALRQTDSNGNISEGDVMAIDTTKSIIVSDGLFVGVIGMQDVIVVVDQGCVLVCPKERSQQVKQIVRQLKASDRDELI